MCKVGCLPRLIQNAVHAGRQRRRTEIQTEGRPSRNAGWSRFHRQSDAVPVWGETVRSSVVRQSVVFPLDLFVVFRLDFCAKCDRNWPRFVVVSCTVILFIIFCVNDPIPFDEMSGVYVVFVVALGEYERICICCRRMCANMHISCLPRLNNCVVL